MEQEITNKPDKKLNISLFINFILLIAVAFLYILYFTGKNNTTEPAAAGSNYTAVSGLLIGYVDSDSILAHYTLAINKSNELAEKGKSMEAEFRKRQDQYEKDASYFQDQVAKNQLSEQSAQFIYNQLMEEQQKLYELQNKYTSDLADMEMQVNLMLLDSVTNFLERYNRKLNFDYIFGHNPGSNLLLKNQKYNITNQVIEGLNKEYAIETGK